MHHKFANWYQPVTFGHDRESLELRWKGVELAIKNIDFPEVKELVRLVFDKPLLTDEFKDTFRQNFITNDPTFQTTGNDLEVKVLAGCVLAILCCDYDMQFVPLTILTASACGTRAPEVEIDLMGLALEKVRLDGTHARERPAMSRPTKALNKKVFDEAIELLTTTQDIPTVLEALKKMSSATVSLYNSIQKATHSEISNLQKTLTVQDEELQMLWWMVSGWSTMWDICFSDIDSRTRPIMLAKEADSLTEETSESPSLKAVFSRVGIDGSSELTIPDAVNACGVEKLTTLAPKIAPCSTIFPLHFAMSRALETGANTDWIVGWSKVTGIAEKAKVLPLELAVQTHRELKLMKLSEATNE